MDSGIIGFLTSEYTIHLYILIGIYLILAQSLNLPFGVGLLFNLAHIAAYAIGAYTTALFATELQIGVVRCLLASALFSGLFSLIIGAISLRLSQDYFAIGTLAFSALVSALLINWKSLTRGVLGIPGIPRPEIMGIDFYNSTNFLALTYLVALISLILLYILFRNSFTRKLKCQAEYEQAALALGIDTRLIRVMSFFVASALAGMAGGLFAYYIQYIDPSSFALNEMIFVLTIVVVGRPGSFWGVIGAAVFLVLLPEPLRFVEMPPSILGPLRQALHALILFFVVYVNRGKLFPVQRTV